MVPLDIRMRYNIPLKNPILAQIQRQYAFAYTVAVCACSVLSSHYGKAMPEDEIAYLAVLFALAMEQRDRPSRRYNIVVVCVSGRGTSQLFLYNYKRAFGKYINRIGRSHGLRPGRAGFQRLADRLCFHDCARSIFPCRYRSTKFLCC